MRFDHFTVALLKLSPDAPKLDEQAVAGLRDAHMAHLAHLHEAGYLLAAGPLAFDDPGEELCGLSILNVDLERARDLAEQDPAVRAGLFSVQVLSWMVPAGAMTFSKARFPRSMADAAGD